MSREAQEAGPVAAGIVLYQPDPALLRALLAAIAAGGRRLFIAANGPLPEAAEAVLATLKDATILRSADNAGLGAGLNRLCERAAAEGRAELLLLDQDSEPAADLPEKLRQRMRQAQAAGMRVAAVAPRLIAPDGEHFRTIRYDWLDRDTGKALFAPTSGSLICLSAYEEIGPFRADFFIGGIDVEWGLRANRAGHVSLIAQDLDMVHRWGTATDPKARWRPQILRHSPLRNYYYLRNALICLRTGGAPSGWRLSYSFNLAAQVALLLLFHLFDRKMRHAVFRAIGDGMRGRLGPAPEGVASSE